MIILPRTYATVPILPFVIFLVNCLSFRRSFVLFVGICALGEWFTCVFHVPDNVYRLLFYRYLFLLYLGCVILKFKIKLNVWVCRLALIALFLAILEIYTSVDLMPYLNTFSCIELVTELTGIPHKIR